jgi:hypothetical protein
MRRASSPDLALDVFEQIVSPNALESKIVATAASASRRFAS